MYFRDIETGATSVGTWLLRVSLLAAAASACTVAHADVRVVALPLAAEARGLDLQPGDVLREPAAAVPLDAWRLAELELAHGSRGSVPLTRIRGTSASITTLPPGEWDLVTLPEAVAQGAARDSHVPDGLSAVERAAVHLARAQLAARAGRFADAQLEFDHAAEAGPERGFWIDRARIRALEGFRDRSASADAAERLVRWIETHRVSREQLAAAWMLAAQQRALARRNEDAEAAARSAWETYPESLIGANAKSTLAFLMLRTGRIDEARAELASAIAIANRIAPESLDAVLIRQRRATLAIVAQDDESARREFAAIVPELRRLAPGSLALGKVTFNAHLHALERRRYAEAEAYARESLAALGTAAPESLEHSQARAALAEVLTRRAEFGDAEALLREALASSTQADPSSYEAISVQVQLGDNLRRQGRASEALALYDAVLGSLRDDATQVARATMLASDAKLYRADALLDLGRCEEGVASAREALAEFERAGRRGAPVYEAQLLLAECALRLGQPAEARRHADTALAGFEAIAAQGVQQAQAHYVVARALRDEREPAAATDAFEAALAALERHRTLVGGNADIRARWQSQYQDIYKDAILHAVSTANARRAHALDARYRLQVLWRLLGVDDAAAPEGWFGSADFDIGAVRLAEDQAQVTFVVGREQVVALLVLPGGELKATVLPQGAARIRDLAERALMLTSIEPSEREIDPAVESTLRELHVAVVEPLGEQLGTIRRWIVVGDGPLLQVPWAALLSDTRPKRRYLVEDHIVSLAPSTAVWAALAASPAAPEWRTIVAVAGSTDDAGQDWQRSSLPATIREIDSIEAAFPGRVRRMMGAGAHEELVRESMRSADVFHFAGHSVVDGRRPMDSYLALPRASSMHAADDGMLSAREIAEELSLRASLVVLASCSSARGAVVGGDGLVGLTRSLHLAGAREVIGTLWQVADAPTSWIVGRFYAQLRDEVQVEDALARAQREWLDDARDASLGARIRRTLRPGSSPAVRSEHPYYWAGLVVSGAD